MIDVVLRTKPTAACEFHLGHVDVHLAALPEAIVAVITAIVRVRVPLLEPLQVLIAHRAHERNVVEPVAADAVEEPDFRIEVLANLHIPQRVVPGRRLVAGTHAVSDIVPGPVWRVGLRAPPVHRPRFADADPAIRA